MHFADAFIQSDLHCIQVTVFFYIWSALYLIRLYNKVVQPQYMQLLPVM